MYFSMSCVKAGGGSGFKAVAPRLTVVLTSSQLWFRLQDICVGTEYPAGAVTVSAYCSNLPRFRGVALEASC